MGRSFVRFILLKFGLDWKERPTIRLQSGDPPKLTPEDGVRRILDSDVIAPYAEYHLTFEGVQGQRVTIEITTTGTVWFRFYEGHEEQGVRRIRTRVHPAPRRWRMRYVLPHTGIYTVVFENPQPRTIRVRLRIVDDTVKDLPRKKPLHTEKKSARSAAAGATGNGKPDDRRVDTPPIIDTRVDRKSKNDDSKGGSPDK